LNVYPNKSYKKESEKVSKVQFMTIKELYEISKSLISNDKGDYGVYLSTGGYYDGKALDHYDVDNDDRTLTLYT
jgi:hypothetical protein